MRLYRHIALGFVLVTAAILVAVIYASMVRAIIRITPVEQRISSSFIVDVSAKPVEEGEVRGRVLARTVDLSDSFSLAAGAENATPVEGKANGVVKITNNRSSDQSLVKTTRFLSEGGVLFRLDNPVTVPAGGSVEARITADAPGATGDVLAGKWTIPGLSESVQKLVYGETTEPMTGGLRYVNALTQADADAAVESLKAEAIESVLEAMRTEVGVFQGEALLTEVLESKIEPAVGTETDRFTVALKVQVTGVFFDEEELYAAAESALYANLEGGLRPVGVDAEDLKFSVERYDIEKETATLKVELSGSAIPSAAHQALSRGVFAGMTPQEVVAYFEQNGLAKTVEVDLRPSWLDHIPRSPNKIKLLINE